MTLNYFAVMLLNHKRSKEHFAFVLLKPLQGHWLNRKVIGFETPYVVGCL